jgi:hypothetical protein
MSGYGIALFIHLLGVITLFGGDRRGGAGLRGADRGALAGGGLLPPTREVHRAGKRGRPAIFERFSEEHFPECFKEYADLLTWDAYLHATLDTSKPHFGSGSSEAA